MTTREPSVLTRRRDAESAPWTTIRSLVVAAPGIARRARKASAKMRSL
jgi:hypothetical protein